MRRRARTIPRRIVKMSGHIVTIPRNIVTVPNPPVKITNPPVTIGAYIVKVCTYVVERIDERVIRRARRSTLPALPDAAMSGLGVQRIGRMRAAERGDAQAHDRAALTRIVADATKNVVLLTDS